MMEPRNILWDYIIDTIDVSVSVQMCCLLDTIFGVYWSGFDDMDTMTLDELICGIAVIIYGHFFGCIPE